VQEAIVEALLSYGALKNDRMRGIAHDCEARDCLRERVEPLDAIDERSGALVHLLPAGHVSIWRNRMKRRMSETHDAIRVASEKPGFVFSLTRLEFPAYTGERIRG
jgi:hypothetical protein